MGLPPAGASPACLPDRSGSHGAPIPPNRPRIVLALTAAIALVLAGYLALAGNNEPWALRSPTGECALHAEPVVELRGDQVAAGLVRLTTSRVYLERVSEIAVFDRQGRFLGSLGRAGDGPGEFRRIQAMIPLPGEELAVVQANPPQLTIIDSAGNAQSTNRLPVSIGRDGALMLPDGSFVLTGALLSGSGPSGHPIVRTAKDGQVLNFFGQNEVETDGPMRGRLMPRLLAWHPRTGVVSVKRFRYAVEQWNKDGTLAATFARPVDWLQWPPAPAAGDPHGLGPPEDQFRAVQVDNQGRLWLVAQITPGDWKRGLTDGGVIDQEKWTDTHVEVLDLASGSVVCSARFQPFVLSGFAGPLQIASYREDEAGHPRITIWQLSLSGRQTADGRLPVNH